MCTIASHSELKKDRETFEAATIFRGWQQDIDLPPFELRQCRACGSTLCDGTRLITIENAVEAA